MPSTVVHVAFAGMIAAALLGSAFDRRALVAVLVPVAAADLDAFLGLVSSVGHRTAFHTLAIPGVAALALAADLRLRERSWLLERYGARGVRVAWVGILAYAAAAIGLDLFSAGGANPLWPLHDQFYRVDGKIELSTRRGIVQTFLDVGSDGATQARGSAEEVVVTTGVNPSAGAEPENVERIFPIARSGWQLLLLLVGTFVTAARFWVDE